MEIRGTRRTWVINGFPRGEIPVANNIDII